LNATSSVPSPHNAPKSVAAGALPQTPLGELTALPVPLAGLKGPTSKGIKRGRRAGEGEGEQGREQ